MPVTFVEDMMVTLAFSDCEQGEFTPPKFDTVWRDLYLLAWDIQYYCKGDSDESNERSS